MPLPKRPHLSSPKEPLPKRPHLSSPKEKDSQAKPTTDCTVATLLKTDEDALEELKSKLQKRKAEWPQLVQRHEEEVDQYHNDVEGIIDEIDKKSLELAKRKIELGKIKVSGSLNKEIFIIHPHLIEKWDGLQRNLFAFVCYLFKSSVTIIGKKHLKEDFTIPKKWTRGDREDFIKDVLDTWEGQTHRSWRALGVDNRRIGGIEISLLFEKLIESLFLPNPVNDNSSFDYIRILKELTSFYCARWEPRRVWQCECCHVHHICSVCAVV